MSRTTRFLATIITATLCFGTLDATPVAAQEPPTQPAPNPEPAPLPAGEQVLPGGASQLEETHGDWRVVCAQPSGQKVCSLSQQQTDANSQQLVLGIELQPVADNAEGTLVLPFGLAVTKPITLQIDESGPTQNAAFRTCIPAGCLVPIALEPSMVASLRNGTTLTVTAATDGGQDAVLRISLRGFGSAFDRTAALAK